MKAKSKTVVELLKNEANTNPAFKAVAQVFAERQRTRYKVTIANLMAVMKGRGVTYEKQHYANILMFLANLGFGTLVTDGKKRVKALDHIKVTLQSIGKAALEDAPIKRQSPTHRFKDLNKAVETVHATDFIAQPGLTEPKESKSGVREKHYPAFLTVLIEGKLVAFPGPSDIKPENLGEYLVKFKELGR